MFWIAGCSILRAEGFSCSLGVLYRGLGISKLQFLFKKYNFFSFKYFQFFVNKTLDPELGPDLQLEKMLDPDPQSEKCWIRIRFRIRIKSMRIRNPASLDIL
jgi:hypothetical protein